MSIPFTPADGEKPRWSYCYDLVISREPGDAITYEEVMELLGCTREQALQAMWEAQRHLERDKRRTVGNRRKFGWIVLDGRGMLTEVKRRTVKAARQVTRAVRVHNATPRAELSQMERAELDFHGRNLLASQALYNRRPPEMMELMRASEERKRSELPMRRQLDR